MKIFTLGGLGVTFTVGGSVVAFGTTFQNHLASPIMVSPTQIHQVEETKTDFSLGYSMKTDSNKVDGKSTETSDVSTDVFAGGVFNVGSTGLRTGVTAEFKSLNQKLDEKDTLDGTQVTLTPQAAYSFGPLVVGAAFDLIQKSAKPEDSSELKTDYFRFRPGVAYSSDKIEAGVVYVNPTRKDDPNSLKIQEPAQVTLHGRFGISPDVVLGGILTNSNYKAIDEEAFTDQLSFKGTAEYLLTNFKLEGNAGYSSAYYENKEEDMNKDTIANVVIGAAGDYNLNKMASLGAAAAVNFGSDSNKTVEVANNATSIALRGNVRF